MATLKAVEIQTEVEVSVKGDFRRVAIAIEATGVNLLPKADAWVGKKKIPIAHPLNVKLTFKGPEEAEFTLELTIEKKIATVKGKLEIDGINHVEKNLNVEDFK